MSEIEVTSNPIVEVKPLFGASLRELTGLMESLNQPAYRARQLYDALFTQRVPSLDQITTLPASLREKLKAAGHTIGLPELVQTARSIDGTERYLVRLADGETVETVWMPGGDGGERGDGTQAAEEEEHPTHDDGAYKRGTICISRQVGWPVQLPVLPHRQAGHPPQPHPWRNSRPGRRRPQPPQRRSRARPNQPRLHGHGRALPQLRSLHRRRRPPHRRHAHPRIPYDRQHLRHPPRHPRLRPRDRPPQAGRQPQR